MALTPEQLAVVKSYILATPALAALTSGAGTDYNTIANVLSAAATPPFVVWRSSISRDDVMGDGFDWTQIDNLSVGQARIWDWLFDNNQRTMNPSNTRTRSGIGECWKGTTAKLAVGTYVLTQCKRNAAQVEKLFAIGTGSDASPAKMVHEGGITLNEVAGLFN